MTKIIVIGDLHIGHTKDDPWREEYINKFMTNVTDYAQKHGIKNIIQTGDVFDSTSGLTHATLKTNNDSFINPVQQKDLTGYIIVGNHDLRFKNTLTPNAVREIFGKQKNFNVYDEPTTVNIGGIDIDMIPWICEENEERIMNFIKNSSSKVCVGHFELSGFMYNATTPSSGFEPNFLTNYELVISGHYHTINSGSNVQYVGTPYTLNFNDVNEHRGFWILDTENIHDMEFIPNEDMWHKQIDYVDDLEVDFEEYRNKSVRIRIETEVNKDKYGEFIDKIAEVAHATKLEDLYTIKNNKDLKNILDSEILVSGGILEIGSDRITKNANNDEVSKSKQISILESLYQEAELLMSEE